MELRFAGDLALWQGLTLGLIVAIGAWWVYRRETKRGVVGAVRWLLPLLRAVAVLLALLMLTGPVLHHRQIIGQLSRVMVFIDGSQSMTVPDPQMSVERKLLAAIRAGGWLPESALDHSAARAAESLAEAQAALSPLKSVGRSPQTIKQAAALFAQAAREAGAQELATAAQKIAGNIGSDDKSLDVARDRLLALGTDAAAREREARQKFLDACQRITDSGNRAVTAALAKFDEMSRWQRALSILLDTSGGGVVQKLAQRHQVELFTLDGAQAAGCWTSQEGQPPPPPEGLALSASRITDLADPLKSRMTAGAVSKTAAPGEEPQRTAAVLITDGGHNEGSSPVAMAQVLGTRQIPLYTIGMGSDQPPIDLAVVKVEGPESVFREDRVRGQVTLSDRIPAGKPFTLRIEHDGQLLAEQKLVTQGGGVRIVPFDFSIAELVKKALESTDRDVRTQSLPLGMTVSVSAIEGEARPDNNTASLHLRAITSEPKLLIIDGRARWETRYLRNLFERDARWKVNTIIAGPSADLANIKRGSGPGEFPTERRALLAYDLIVFGEVGREMLSDEEQAWLRDFVTLRGGGLIFIDGQRQKLRDYAGSPLESLIPVRWESGEGVRPQSLEPTPVGLARSSLTLGGDAKQSAQTWKTLAAPHWIAPVTVTPGSGEVLVEAVADNRRAPLMVERRVGAGKVLYMATDETWRWRYEVADLHYQRLWNQAAAAAMEQPYAVADQFVSLDAGTALHRPGESVEVRVRLRDGDGKPVVQATAEAVLSIGGKTAATVPLEPDENEGGVFRGKTPPLGEGTYDVSVRVTGFPESQMKARTQVVVQGLDTPEMTDLACNEELLRQMASASGGVYLPEEQADRLADLLQPLSAGRVVESDTPLGHSYWWFGPIVGLLTVEWLLRKRSGMM